MSESADEQAPVRATIDIRTDPGAMRDLFAAAEAIVNSAQDGADAGEDGKASEAASGIELVSFTETPSDDNALEPFYAAMEQRLRSGRNVPMAPPIINQP